MLKLSDKNIQITMINMLKDLVGKRLQYALLKDGNINRLKVKVWKKIYHINTRGKKASVAVSISER